MNNLYSYQEEYFLKKMNLEDCIAAAAKAGATGIEMIGEQSISGFPKLTDAFVDQWFGWMDKYKVTPVAHDMFLDYNKKKGHYYTDDEAVKSFKRDILFAHKLGFKVIRVIVNTTPEIIEKVLPFAEYHDIKLGIEVHAPWHINSAWMARHWEVMEKTGTKHFGFIPDMGGFTKRLPRVQVDRLIRQGADPKIAEYVCQQHEKGVMAEYTIYEVSRMSDRRIDMSLAELSRHNTYVNPISLVPHIDRIVHIHGKFLEMLEDYTEWSIPYKEVIDVLKTGGYDGYIASEYEGNRHIQDVFEVDSVEQVRRHQVMLERLITC
jgi:sugar phosphate isomerase/epimerase